MKFYVILGVIILTFIALTVFEGNKTPMQPARQIVSASSFDSLIGKPAPNFILPSLNGKTYSLSSLKGKKIVLFFNEGIMCYPACWNQIAALGTDAQLNNADVVSFSIVPDTLKDWTSASYQMHDLAKETVLLDTNVSVSNAYGMLELPSSMHRGMKPGHTYVVINASGIVRYSYDDPTMNIQDHKLEQEVKKL